MQCTTRETMQCKLSCHVSCDDNRTQLLMWAAPLGFLTAGSCQRRRAAAGGAVRVGAAERCAVGRCRLGGWRGRSGAAGATAGRDTGCAARCCRPHTAGPPAAGVPPKLLAAHLTQQLCLLLSIHCHREHGMQAMFSHTSVLQCLRC